MADDFYENIMILKIEGEIAEKTVFEGKTEKELFADINTFLVKYINKIDRIYALASYETDGGLTRRTDQLWDFLNYYCIANQLTARQKLKTLACEGMFENGLEYEKFLDKLKEQYWEDFANDNDISIYDDDYRGKFFDDFNIDDYNYPFDVKDYEVPEPDFLKETK